MKKNILIALSLITLVSGGIYLSGSSTDEFKGSVRTVRAPSATVRSTLSRNPVTQNRTTASQPTAVPEEGSGNCNASYRRECLSDCSASYPQPDWNHPDQSTGLDNCEENCFQRYGYPDACN